MVGLVVCGASCACNGALGIDALRNVDCVGDGCADAGLDADAQATEAGSDEGAPPDSSHPALDAGPDAAPCLSDATDFYVRTTNPCAFQSISDAVDAARKSGALARTIHVAAGTYSATTGERLPLDLRGGISLEGVTASSPAILLGVGNASHSLEGGSQAATLRATILTGSIDGTSTIKNVHILSNEAAASDTFGIFCDRGNAQATLPEPSPNLLVDNVTIGASYGVGLLVSNSSVPKSGCNARITSSTIATDNVIGVKVGDCDGTPASAMMALDIGGASHDEGNAFNSVGTEDLRSGAVVFGSCTASATARNNTFFSGAAGVIVDHGGAAANVSITDNAFKQQRAGGVHLLTGQIDDLSRNDFRACGNAGLWIEGAGTGVLRARDNTFVGNRTGVTIWAKSGVFDFGSDTSPGGNDFRCNSILPNESGFGYDVSVYYVPPGASVLFSGNRWDHAPPTLALSDSPSPDGTDIVQSTTSAAAYVGTAAQSTLACPATNVP